MLGRGYRYWIGGLTFGLGWGLTSSCPGPLFALLGSGTTVVVVPLAAAVAGSWAYGHLRSRLRHYRGVGCDVPRAVTRGERRAFRNGPPPRRQAMRSKHTPLALLSAVVLALAAVLAPARPTSPDRPADPEVARIQAHLAGVEEELRTRNISDLTPAQRRERARQIRRLREYRERGVFPHNHHIPDRRAPYFVDDHGTLCAVAYLIAASGRRDLVARVAATRNNAYVPELAADAELAVWLESVGLTVAEAARIQPAYGPQPIEREDEVTGRYALASAVAGGLGGAAIALNLEAAPGNAAWWRGSLGLGAGVLGLAVGASGLDGDGASQVLGGANLGLGAAAAFFGTRTLLSASGPASSATDGRGLEFGAAPLLPLGGAPPGLLVRVSF